MGLEKGKFVIWYVKNVMIFAENSEMYIPKINYEKWYVFFDLKYGFTIFVV